MAHRGVSRYIIWFCVHLMLFIAIVASKKDCSKKQQCPYQPPLAHYRTLNCTQVNYTTGPLECCPNYYDCRHLYERHNRYKCYVNGHQYRIGEPLKKEDDNLCEEECYCENIGNGLADFVCKTNHTNKCAPYVPTKNCYQRKPLEQCCSTDEICPDTPGEVRPVCKIHGKTYLDEEYFIPEKHQDLLCICRAYKSGKFRLSCVKSRLWSDIHAVPYFYKNCAPVYLPYVNNTFGIQRQLWRCQQPNDKVLKKTSSTPPVFTEVHNGPLSAMYCPKPEMDYNDCPKPAPPCLVINSEGPMNVTFDLGFMKKCILGQLVMDISQVLTTIPHNNDLSCVVCTCEVPPVPTCTLHPKGDICKQTIK